MIQTNPNPKMTAKEVDDFRNNIRKCATMDFTPSEIKEIQERKERIHRVALKVIRNNGGKNPILGY